MWGPIKTSDFYRLLPKSGTHVPAINQSHHEKGNPNVKLSTGDLKPGWDKINDFKKARRLVLFHLEFVMFQRWPWNRDREANTAENRPGIL